MEFEVREVDGVVEGMEAGGVVVDAGLWVGHDTKVGSINASISVRVQS